VVDALREVTPPFSPEQVVERFSSLLRSYNCDKVVGDRYAGEWPVDMFRRFNIRFEQAARPKSDLYVDLLASLNSRRVDLLDNPRPHCRREPATPPLSSEEVGHAAAGEVNREEAERCVAADCDSAAAGERGRAFEAIC
jgi:hypothetical protein